MKKYLFLIVIAVVIAGACSKKTFELQSATSKRFGGGTILSGTGVVYTFELLVFRSWEKITIDSVYIGNRCFTNISMYTKGSPPGTKAYYQKGDTLVVSVTHSKRPFLSNDQPPKVIDGKFVENGLESKRDLNGAAALIIIKMKDNFYEIPVREFLVLPPEMRP